MRCLAMSTWRSRSSSILQRRSQRTTYIKTWKKKSIIGMHSQRRRRPSWSHRRTRQEKVRT